MQGPSFISGLQAWVYSGEGGLDGLDDGEGDDELDDDEEDDDDDCEDRKISCVMRHFSFMLECFLVARKPGCFWSAPNPGRN